MKTALFTMARNEPVFLPLWARYAAQNFEPEDVFVLDHGSDDGSVEVAQAEFPFERVPIRHWPRTAAESEDAETEFEMWKAATIRDAFERLLRAGYEAALYLDADEVAVPDPDRHESLRTFLDAFHGPWLRLGARTVLQTREEPPWDPMRPVLAQRRLWAEDPRYQKPVLSCRALAWSIGCHEALLPNGIWTDDLEPSRDLFLVHLQQMDLDVFRQRRITGWAADDTDVEDLFYEPLVAGVEIPERFRAIV